MTNHIKSIQYDGRSWCGKILGNDFHFKNVEAAVYNGKHGSKLPACPACTKLIIEVLTIGQYNNQENVSNE